MGKAEPACHKFRCNSRAPALRKNFGSWAESGNSPQETTHTVEKISKEEKSGNRKGKNPKEWLGDQESNLGS